MSAERLDSARREQNPTVKLVNAYSALRMVLEAITLSRGFRVYSHEAYVAYLEELEEVIFSERFDRLRRLRNGAEYYGEPVSKEVALAALQDIEEMCRVLTPRYLAEVYDTSESLQ